MARSFLLPLAAVCMAAPVAAQGNSTPPAPPVAPAAPAPPAPPPAPFTAEETERYMALGRKVNTWFLEGLADSIVAIAPPEIQDRMGGVEGVMQQMAMFAERAGPLIRVVEEKMTRRDGQPQFWFEAEFVEFANGTLVLRWVFNEEGQLVGAGMGPRAGARADGM